MKKNVNYNEILGVGDNASDEEIKRAFRKKAKEHHPDIGGDPDFFCKYAHAYAILTGKKNESTPDVDYEAIRAVSQLFREIVIQQQGKNPDEINIIGIMRANIKERLKNLDIEEEQCNRFIAYLQVVSAKIKRKDGENFLKSVVDHELNNCEGQKNQMQNVRSVVNRISSLIDEFDYDFKRYNGFTVNDQRLLWCQVNS